MYSFICFLIGQVDRVSKCIKNGLEARCGYIEEVKEEEGHLSKLGGLTLSVDIECWFHKATPIV